MVQKGEHLKLGLDLKDYKYDAKYCVGCDMCRWVDFVYMSSADFSQKCPPWQKYKLDAYGVAGKARIIYDLLTGKLDYSSDSLREIVYKCMLCGACDAGCKRNLDLEPLMMLEALRAKLVTEGLGPLPEHEKVTKRIEESHNYYGRSQEQRLKWMPEEVNLAANPEVLYFAGCRASFTSTEIGQAAVRILQAAKVPFTVLKEEPCCGYFLYATGQVEKARKLAEENLKLVKETGVKTVVFSCAEGYKTFKVDYPKLLGISTNDLGFEVKHLVELVSEWVKNNSLQLKNNIDMKVTYHDPCNLGRLSEPWFHWEGERGDWGIYNPPRQIRRGTFGVYEPPRDILKSIPGVELVEMPRHHENAWCCGSGGGVKEAFPELASWSADERLREASTVGTEAIVSACPSCKESFAQRAKVTKNRIKVYDILELVAKAISG